MNILQTPLFYWSLALIVLFPVAITLLGEWIERLRRLEHPLAAPLRLMRDAVLPALAVLLVLRHVMLLDEASLLLRMAATLFWSFTVVAIFRLFRNLFRPVKDRAAWYDNTPRLVLNLPGYSLMLLIVLHLVQNVWGQPIGELATTLGIGSVVIAFALQETLSNLVSGLLLLINQPFAAGEWIRIGDTTGCVQEVNWRATLIKTWDGDLMVIPNGAIAQESILNHSRPTPLTRRVQAIDVAYVNPPNKVKRMLMETMRNTPGILADPPPEVAVIKIDDPLMGYEVRYWIADYGRTEAIHNEFMTRVWYNAQRHGVPFPSPAFDLFHYDGPTIKKEAELTPATLAARLRQLSTFQQLPSSAVEQLAQDATLLCFAHSEELLASGDTEAGLYILLSGAVHLSALDAAGVEQQIARLHAGDLFGETGLFNRPISPFRAVAAADVEVICTPHAIMNMIINNHPQFADGVNAIVTERQKAIKRMVDAAELLAHVADAQAGAQRAPLGLPPVHANGTKYMEQGR